MLHWKQLLATPAQPAATLLRVALGSIMLPHGAQHLLGWFGGYGFGGTLQWMVSVGFPAPLAALAIITEFVAPIALILGLGGRLAALGIAGIMAGAAITHIPNGFFMNWFGSLPAGAEGFEYHLLVLVMSLALVIEGSGAFSLDRWLVNRQPGRKPAFTTLGLFSLMLLVTACSDDQVSDPAAEPPVAAVSINPDTLTLLVGQTRPLEARVVGADGSIVHGRQITWRVDDELVALVSSGGVITARRPGEVTVTAMAGGRSGTAAIRVVRPAPVAARVEVSPNDVVVTQGQTRDLAVRVFEADGTELPAPPAGSVQWVSLNPGVATVNAQGTVTAVASGTTQVRATIGNISGEARVSVPAALWTEYQLAGAPIRVREYEVIRDIPNMRFYHLFLLVSAMTRLAANERRYTQRFTIEKWETRVDQGGNTMSTRIETIVTEDSGDVGEIAGVGDLTFHSDRNGAIFFGRRTATSLETLQDVPGAINKFTLVFNRN